MKIQYTREIKVNAALTNGYQTFCDIQHPLAYKYGWVYLHRHVASIKYNRWLNSKEIVHHKDGDRLNNNPDNLEVLNRSEHGQEHFPPQQKKRKCKFCGKYSLRVGIAECRLSYCSPECHGNGSKKIDWPAPEVIKEWLWREPTTKIAAQLGVSDVAISKFCRKHSLEKPPRGYWKKIEVRS